MIKVYTDGGARGNPGPAATGVYITDEKGSQLYGAGKTIGQATNNVAEYKAVIDALQWLIKNKSAVEQHKKISFFVDSELIYSQIIGVYKVKKPHLQSLLFLVRELEARITAPIHYVHIPREQNTNADAYVNKALNALLNQ